MKKLSFNQGLSTIVIIIILAVVVIGGVLTYIIATKNSSTGIVSVTTTTANPCLATTTWGTNSATTSPCGGDASNSPVTPVSQQTRPVSSGATPLGACDYLTTSDISSVGITVVQSLSPQMGSAASACIYLGATTGSGVSVAISGALLKAPDSTITSVYQQSLKQGYTPVQGIGDMAGELIKGKSIVVVFWKNKIFGTVTVTAQGASKAQAEQLAKLAASKI